MGQKGRLDRQYLAYLDWVRAYAMLLGIPAHVAVIYYKGHPWFISSPDSSITLSFIANLISSLRMPIFFIVAGMLSAIVLVRRPTGEWLLRRAERLLAPLITSTLTISILVILAMGYYASLAADGEPFWNAAWALFKAPGSHWVGHLWFLQSLMIFTLFAAGLAPFIPRLVDWLALKGVVTSEREIRNKWFLALLAGLIAYRFLIEAAFYTLDHGLGIGMPFWGMLRLEPMAENAPYFMLGLLLKDLKVAPIERMGIYQGALFMALLSILFISCFEIDDMQSKMLWFVVAPVMSLLGSLMIMNIASLRVKRSSPLTKYLVDGAFTVYLVHFPIVVWLGVLFIGVELPVMLEFIIITTMTLALSFGFHELISKSPLLLYMFNGIRPAASLVKKPEVAVKLKTLEIK